MSPPKLEGLNEGTVTAGSCTVYQLKGSKSRKKKDVACLCFVVCILHAVTVTTFTVTEMQHALHKSNKSQNKEAQHALTKHQYVLTMK